MAIANQGYRRDLNLKETTNDSVAIDNLAGSGTAVDISYLQNNLRNISSIPFNSVDSDGFFSFATDREITTSGLSSSIETDSDGNLLNTSVITVTLTNPYLLRFGDLVELSGINQTGATDLNAQYNVFSVSLDLKTITFKKQGQYNFSSISGSTFKFKSTNIFTFTNGDVINLSEDVTFNLAIGGPTTTLASNINYYVIESNGVNKFKLSTTENGTSVLPIVGVSGGTPNYFQFIRQDAVHQQQVLNYIKPQIQDQNGDFDYLGGGTINNIIDSTQSNIESAEYFTFKKYRGDQSITTSESIKFEGSIVLNDPDNYNQTGDLVTNQGVTGAPAPGIYISDTRAFSADNNPWSESSATGNDNGKLTTESEEVSIGELAFLDGNASMVITGIDAVQFGTGSGTADSFTHKIPIQIQDGSGSKETYYLLVSNS
tara:strand:+ start:2263 stop:3552 length:1290 start_codon:yes stop_codon:yes gene_type:complete